MSTGANCIFYEKTPGEWFYKLQCYPYGSSENYDTFGPFGTFKIAHDHLNDHHANPGGYSIGKSFPCKHDLLRVIPEGTHRAKVCDRCGESWPSEAYAAQTDYEAACYRFADLQRNRQPSTAEYGALLKTADAHRKHLTDPKKLDGVLDKTTIKAMKAGKYRLDPAHHSNAFVASLTK